MGVKLIDAGDLWIEIKFFLHIYYSLLVCGSRPTTTKAGWGKQDTCQWLIGPVLIKTNRSDKTEIKKFFKNQRPPAEVAPAPTRGHPHTPSSAGGRWFLLAIWYRVLYILLRFVSDRKHQDNFRPPDLNLKRFSGDPDIQWTYKIYSKNKPKFKVQ